MPECFKARIRAHAPKIYISQNHSSLKLFTNSDKGNIRENYINYYHKVHLYAFCGKMFVNFTKSISMPQNISQMASTLEKKLDKIMKITLVYDVRLGLSACHLYLKTKK